MMNFDVFIDFCLIYIEKVSQKNVTRVFIFFIFTYIKHQSHHRAGKSKPISLNRPEVPEEVDTAAMRRRGNENSRWRLNVTVGRKGRRAFPFP